MIRLIGPGGAGKSTIGALLAERLDVPFVDLDQHFAGRVGDISEYIGRHGYEAYVRANVEAYCSIETMRPAAAIVDEILAVLSPTYQRLIAMLVGPIASYFPVKK